MADAVPSNFLSTEAAVDVRPGEGTTPELTNGQTIHFTADEKCQAAVITHVYPEDSRVDLVSFVNGVWFLTGVPHGEVGQVATWHLFTDHDSAED